MCAGLPDLDFKANLVTCDIVDTIIKAVEKAPSTKFVMKLKDDKSRSSEFAVSFQHLAFTSSIWRRRQWH